MNAVTTSTRVGFWIGEFLATSSFNAPIAEESNTNLRITRFGASGRTDGLVELGVKSGVLRGGKRAAELKTGETPSLRSRRAVAAQHLMNELSVQASAIL